ncbi:arabinogalactan protein 41 [Gossypium raimondii]|uniref:Arabinogalactan peptide 22-like n=1 Tax=Gossypium raimondii TaxID=29730 RepID=A0A0D2U9F1_GOSRA|nr:arabinogalactan protein 41 [Gossypium raimondii]KJB52255.1 hypothetical protein B456_008G252400 [Gossypium raimondii]MBA0593474.1 hypothetical protein [Gossypium raimondii]
MAVSKVSFVAVFAGLVFTLVALPAAVQAQSSAPAPAPTSDGTSIDQGIAYVLMLVALVLTYLIHAADLCFTF